MSFSLKGKSWTETKPYPILGFRPRSIDWIAHQPDHWSEGLLVVSSRIFCTLSGFHYAAWEHEGTVDWKGKVAGGTITFFQKIHKVKCFANVIAIQIKPGGQILFPCTTLGPFWYYTISGDRTTNFKMSEGVCGPFHLGFEWGEVWALPDAPEILG